MAMQARLDRYESKEADHHKALSAYEAKAEGKRGGYKGKKRDPDPEWLEKNIKPEPITKTMQLRGNPWHFCCELTGGKCGGKWRKHKPSECRGQARPDGGSPRSVIAEDKKRPATEEKSGDKARLKIMEAMAACLMNE